MFTRLIYFLFFSLLISACVSTPDNLQPALLSTSEYELGQALTRSRQMVATGRLTEAEQVILIALNKDPHNPVLLNDLSYVLAAQTRYREAIKILQTIPKGELRILSVYENLAHALYQDQQYEAAIVVYQDLLNDYLAGRKFIIRNRPTDLPLNDIASLNRNLSNAYYQLGYYDNALCYSERAVAVEQTPAQFSAHARMLMSLDRVNEAYHTLRAVVLRDRDNTSQPILLDYAAILLLQGDKGGASSTLSRVLQSTKTSPQDKISAEIFSALLVATDSKTNEVQTIFNRLIQQEPRVCEQAFSDANGYWPLQLEQKVDLLIENYCVL